MAIIEYEFHNIDDGKSYFYDINTDEVEDDMIALIEEIKKDFNFDEEVIKKNVRVYEIWD